MIKSPCYFMNFLFGFIRERITKVFKYCVFSVSVYVIKPVIKKIRENIQNFKGDKAKTKDKKTEKRINQKIHWKSFMALIRFSIML